MASSDHNKISKFLSYVLRHKPDAIGLTLDDQGWADIDQLIDKANQSGEVTTLDRSLIQTVFDPANPSRCWVQSGGAGGG